MGDDDELAPLRQLLQQRAEAAHVRLVEHRVHLVEHAKRGWVDVEEGEQERGRSQSPLPAGEERQPLRALAWRPGDDVHAGVHQISGVGQLQPRCAAVEEGRERLGEPGRHRIERFPESGLHQFIQFGQHLAQSGRGGLQVGRLLGEETMPLLGLDIFVRGIGVDRPQPAEAGLETPDLIL